MNAKKLALIVLIFIAAGAAWVVLGQTVTSRTDQAKKELGQDVSRMFGPPLVQAAPSIGPVATTAANSPVFRPPDASDISVRFEHENRYRGLIWFSVFKAHFDATYTIKPTTGGSGPDRLRFSMSLPGDANIDEVTVTVDGESKQVDRGQIAAEVDLSDGKPIEVKVGYVSSGQDRWVYDPRSNGGGLRNFRLTATTDFEDIDYPSNGLSPTEKSEPVKTAGGKDGRKAVWDYTQMLPAQNRLIGIVMPSRHASGELSARISKFAPVSLFFFLTVMITIQLVKDLKLHPMNYLLIAAGFFAFHILLAYLVDHLAIHFSFWIAAGVSVFLVVSYLRLVLGAKAAILYAGAAQLVYLVFFSYAFFWHGWTGLTVVIGAVVTLFLIMQLTGRINWDEKFPDLARRKEKFEWKGAPPPVAQVAPGPSTPPAPPPGGKGGK